MTPPARATVVWIAWESQPRNRSMAREIGASLHECLYGGPRLIRYLKSGWATMRILFAARPLVVCAPNPSVALTFLLLALRTILRFRLAMDAHYGGIVAVNGSRRLQWLLDVAIRHADVVIVTNDAHARVVHELGGRAVVCPDPLPDLLEPVPGWAPPDGADKRVLFICSFDADEPYQAVFVAARMLADQGIRMFVSGNYNRAGVRPESVPHVTLLGYVDQWAYQQYIHYAHVLLDLTDFPDCLVCGAYEGMAAGKPCVLSATAALQAYFTHGVIFTTHHPAAIAAAVLRAYQTRSALQADIARWIPRSREQVARQIAHLRGVLGLETSATTTARAAAVAQRGESEGA